MASEFAVLLKELVESYAKNSKITKKQIALLCGFSPSMFSHLLYDRRPMRSREGVLAIARGIKLDVRTTNSLLLLGGFAPLSENEEQGQLTQIIGEHRVQDDALSNALSREDPEAELLSPAAAKDVNTLAKGWDHFFRMRQSLGRREWRLVEQKFDVALEEYYWPIRRSLDRFLAHLYNVRAAAAESKNYLSDGASICRQGLVSADAAEDPVSKVMLLVRLADIEKLRGRFGEAQSDYAEAMKALDEWDRKTAVGKRSFDHWWARIRRKEGSLYLFMGLPQRSMKVLAESAAYFERTGPRYELSRVCYSMGWAYSLLGNWDNALKYHRKGFQITEELNEERGWTDSRSLLQGFLYIGGDYLDRQEYAKAYEFLYKAQDVVESGRDWQVYHEVGRIYLLLGKVYTEMGRFEEAREVIQKGIDFYIDRGDPIRLAAAHNIFGELYLARGEAANAQIEFSAAESSTKQASPRNEHYELAARINWLKAGVKGSGPRDLRLIDELERVGEECRAKSFWQHRARVKATQAEAEVRRVVSEDEREDKQRRIEVAASEALAASCRFNRFLVAEVFSRLLGLSAELPDQQSRESFLRVLEQTIQRPVGEWFSADDERRLDDKLGEIRAILADKLKPKAAANR